jgi:MerR-like DNA binding protein
LRFKQKLEVGMRIGALAERTETSVATIRYYEEIGLLRQAPRRGGQRILIMKTRAALPSSGAQALERSIAALVTICAASCDGGAAADCVILQSQ